MKQKIGVYGGSFDPIHFGHLNLAIELSEKHNLDEVWFCPARLNPYKQDMPPSSAEARLEMLRIAIQDIKGARILDVEVDRPGPSYTIDTIHYLLKKYPEAVQFFLLLGEDAVEGLPGWKQIDELAKLIPFLVAARPRCFSGEQWLAAPTLYEAVKRGMTPTRLMEISSTEIRERISQGKYCGHLVPKEVLDYIYSHGLYSYSNLD